MLGRDKIGGFHYTLVETAQRSEGLEVCRLYKAEIMGIGTVDVVHDHPSVLTDAFPGVGSLTTSWLSINLLMMIVAILVDSVGYHVFDATGILLCHICHELASIRHRADIGVKHLYLLIGIFKQ